MLLSPVGLNINNSVQKKPAFGKIVLLGEQIAPNGESTGEVKTIDVDNSPVKVYPRTYDGKNNHILATYTDNRGKFQYQTLANPQVKVYKQISVPTHNLPDKGIQITQKGEVSPLE